MACFVAALLIFFFAAPQPAHANMASYSASANILWFLCVAYLMVLFLSHRKRNLNYFDVMFWIIMLLITLLFVLFVHLWAFYIGLQFCFLLLKKDRVVFRDRREDLVWYGAWTGIIIVSSLTAETLFWLNHGGIRYWIAQVGSVYPMLLDYVLFGIPVLIYLLRSKKKEKVRQTDELEIELTETPAGDWRIFWAFFPYWEG